MDNICDNIFQAAAVKVVAKILILFSVIFGVGTDKLALANACNARYDNGRIIRYNSMKFVQFFGTSAEMLAGRNIFGIFKKYIINCYEIIIKVFGCNNALVFVIKTSDSDINRFIDKINQSKVISEVYGKTA